MKKGKALWGMFIIWIFGFCAAFCFLPDRSFSPLENRALRPLPKLSLSSVLDGTFMTQFETYVSDQFPGRTLFVRLNSEMLKGIGKKDINGVYLGQKDTFLNVNSFSEETGTANSEAIREFAEKSEVPVAFALIPNSTDLWSSRLPAYAPNPDQQGLIQELYETAVVPAGDIYDTLKEHADEYIYYRTDHHWTSLGAYYGYTALGELLGYTPAALGEAEILSDEFFGTYFAKAPLFGVEPDTITAYIKDEGITVEADTGREIRRGTLYWPEKLKGRDKYGVFLGGNDPLVTVETGHEGPHLLILRDSYCDALTPFLTQHYSRIDLIDPRYWRGSVSEFLSEHDVDQVLVCYSLADFCSDSYLAMALR
jgi:hypothetical protein